MIDIYQLFVLVFFFFFFKQKTAYEIVSRDWSSDVCSSDLVSSGDILVGRLFHYNTVVCLHIPQQKLDW